MEKREVAEIRQNVERATRALVDLGAISHNVREIRKRVGNQRHLMAVVNGLDVNIEGVIPIQPDVNCVRLTGTRF